MGAAQRRSCLPRGSRRELAPPLHTRPMVFNLGSKCHKCGRGGQCDKFEPAGWMRCIHVRCKRGIPASLPLPHEKGLQSAGDECCKTLLCTGLD